MRFCPFSFVRTIEMERIPAWVAGSMAGSGKENREGSTSGGLTQRETVETDRHGLVRHPLI